VKLQLGPKVNLDIGFGCGDCLRWRLDNRSWRLGLGQVSLMRQILGIHSYVVKLVYDYKWNSLGGW
jgi:hypothetical protein